MRSAALPNVVGAESRFSRSFKRTPESLQRFACFVVYSVNYMMAFTEARCDFTYSKMRGIVSVFAGRLSTFNAIAI